MVGESDTVSPTFSLMRGGLFWIGGFAFLFLVIAIFASLIETGNPNPNSRSANATQRRGANRNPDDEPSMGLTPETAVPAPASN